MTTNTARVPRHLPCWRLHLARTGEALDVEAPTLAAALRQAGRPDACHLTHREDGTLAATFDAEALTTFDFRCREATPAALEAWALACVVRDLNREAPRP